MVSSRSKQRVGGRPTLTVVHVTEGRSPLSARRETLASGRDSRRQPPPPAPTSIIDPPAPRPPPPRNLFFAGFCQKKRRARIPGIGRGCRVFFRKSDRSVSLYLERDGFVFFFTTLCATTAAVSTKDPSSVIRRLSSLVCLREAEEETFAPRCGAASGWADGRN